MCRTLNKIQTLLDKVGRSVIGDFQMDQDASKRLLQLGNVRNCCKIFVRPKIRCSHIVPIHFSFFKSQLFVIDFLFFL